MISPRNMLAQSNLGLIPVVLLISVATLFRGGNRYAPLTVIEGLAIAAVALWGASLVMKGIAPKSLGSGANLWGRIALIAMPVWIAIVQLLPTGFGGGSVTPVATQASIFAAIPFVALFLAAQTFEEDDLETLFKVWIATALFQASLGLLQLTDAQALYFGGSMKTGVIGTFANRNHLANFLCMTIPLILYEMHKDSGSGSSKFIWLWGSAMFIVLAAVLATLSRAGISIAFVVSIIGLTTLFGKGRKKHSLRWNTAALIGTIALVLVAGGFDWLDRFESSQLDAAVEMRTLNRERAWQGAVDFWPWGSGLGSFGAVFPKYQPPQAALYFVEHAHNDYIQLIMELGIFFVIGILLIIWLTLRRLRLIFKDNSKKVSIGRINSQAVACGLGTVALALHGWIDFPMRIPANAMFGVFLLGVFLREPSRR